MMNGNSVYEKKQIEHKLKHKREVFMSDYQKLRAVVGLVESTRCRRLMLLEYFDQKYVSEIEPTAEEAAAMSRKFIDHEDGCGNCDNCELRAQLLKEQSVSGVFNGA